MVTSLTIGRTVFLQCATFNFTITVCGTRACQNNWSFPDQNSRTYSDLEIMFCCKIFWARHLVAILICSLLCEFVLTAVSVSASPQWCEQCQTCQSRQPLGSCQSCKTCCVSHRCYLRRTTHDSIMSQCCQCMKVSVMWAAWIISLISARTVLRVFVMSLMWVAQRCWLY